MQYVNRQTGNVFLFLAMAKNIESLKNQVIFCAIDSEQDIFIMAVDKFNAEYRQVENIKNAA